MKVNGCLIMVSITKSAGHLFNHLDFTIEAFGHRIGDTMFEKGQQIRQMTFQRFRHHDHRTETEMGGPVIPTSKKPSTHLAYL